MERTALDNEQGYVDNQGAMAGPYLAPYPPWVQTAAQQDRWDTA